MTSEPITDDSPPTGLGAGLRDSYIVRTIVRRTLLGVLTLFLVSIVVFAATQLLPGDAARAVLGRDATPQRLAAFRREFHLNESVVSQYWAWLLFNVPANTETSLANGLP